MSDKIPISIEQAVDLLRLSLRNGTAQAGNRLSEMTTMRMCAFSAAE